MSEEDTGTLDTVVQDDEVDNIDKEDNLDEDTRYKNQKKRAEIAETNEKLAKDETKRLQDELDELKPSDTTITKDTPASSAEMLERMDLKIDGYPEEILDDIMELGGKKFMKNPVGKKVVDEMVAQHEAAKAANIDASTKSGTETSLTLDDQRKMTAAEQEKLLPHADQ